MTPEQFHTFVADAIRDPERQMWLERRFAPFSAPYRARDGRWILPMAGPNARLSRRLLEAMGLWDQALATGAVFVNPYDPANIAEARRNMGDSLSLGFAYTSRLADMLEFAFATRTAAEWERFLAANGTAATIMMTWEEWQRDADARTAGVFAEISGIEGVQIGRTNWMRSAQPYAPLAPAAPPPPFRPRVAAAGRDGPGRCAPTAGRLYRRGHDQRAGRADLHAYVRRARRHRDARGRDGSAAASGHPRALVGRKLGW